MFGDSIRLSGKENDLSRDPFACPAAVLGPPICERMREREREREKREREREREKEI